MKRTDMRIFLLAVLLCMAVNPAAAHDIEVANDDGVTIYYNFINDNTELEVSYRGSRPSEVYSDAYIDNVIVPQTVNYNGQYYLVTSIGNFAFQECSGLTSVSIPNSVTSIGYSAFASCSGLTSISIPNSVTSIGGSAFYDCSGLTSFFIPNSVTSIGDGVFSYCIGLTSITVDSENGKYDSRDNCNAIIETSTNALIVGCKNTFIPNSVTSIGSSAFFGCSGLTSISIPNSVTSIGNSAFRNCSGLMSISIPNGVTSIGDYAFYACSGLTSIFIPNSVTSIGNNAFRNCNGLTDMYCYAVIVPTTGSMVYYNSNISNATLHVPVSAVEAYKATEPWSGFKEVVAIVDDSEAYAVLSPDKTTLSFYYDGLKDSREGTVYTADNFRTEDNISWGDYSGQITTVVFDESFAAYKGATDYWFRNCTKLNTIQGMENLKVTSIGNHAFSACNGLTSISIPNSVTSIGNSSFSYCRGLTSITISNGVTSIGVSAFERCSCLTSITIPNSVTSIGDAAFLGCSGLTSISIPNSVTSIRIGAFSGCSGLTSISIPNSVTSIQESAFYDCRALTSISIPNSVTSIGVNAFYRCSGLKSISIPNSVTSIGSTAFYGCSALTSISIPNSVTSIGSSAFYGCSALSSIEVDANNKNYDSRENCNAIIETSTNSLIAGCRNTVIPNSVTSIGNYAFYNCSGLTSISIPNRVTSIGNYAFFGCSGLTDMYCYAVIVPTTGSNVYNNSNIGNATLHVPASAVESYKATEPWSGFKEVVAIVDDGEAYAVLSSDGTTLSFYYDGLKGSREGTVYTADNFRTEDNTSWGGNSDQITTVVFDESFAAYKDATDYWFRNCTKLNTIQGMENLTVTSIGNSSFNWCSSLTSISIPNSVTSIRAAAFADCHGLMSISIPNSVTSIDDSAFYGCSGLTSISIANSVTRIGNYAFSGCSALTDVYCYAEIVPTTGANALSDMGNATLHVPASAVETYKATAPWSGFKEVAAIVDDGEAYAVLSPDKTTLSFYYDGLKDSRKGTVYTADNFRTKDNTSWGDCSDHITTVVFDESFTAYKGATDNWFRSCKKLNTIQGMDNFKVTSIGDDAFQYCSGLTSVSIPNSVTSIGNSAFYDCSGLTSISIPNSVTCIGEAAFWNCSGLTSISIPISVTSLGNYAFVSCISLTSITVDSGNGKYDSRDNCNAIIETATNALIVGCKNTIIPNSVTCIGNSAFRGCSGLMSISIPNSVTSIGGGAFCYCYGLTSVSIPNSVTSIGKDAFIGCSSLTSIFIPNSVTSIGSSAFEGCYSLISISIPNSVTSIGYEAFQYCSGLTSISIPNSVTCIENSAFRGCSSLTSISIPNSVTSIGDDAFHYCSGLTSISIPNSVTSIGERAFSGCSGLTSISIPNSVTNIGNNAFYDCSGLADVYCYAEIVPATASNVYHNSNIGNATLHVPASVVETYKATEPWSGFKEVVAIVDDGEAYAVLSPDKTTLSFYYDGLKGIREGMVYTADNFRKGNTGSWGDYSDQITTVVFDESFAAYKGATDNWFRNCNKLNIIKGMENYKVTSIGEYVFAGCSGLTSISIPNSVTSIGKFAFASCSGLTSISIPNSVTSIGNSAFDGCSGLTSISIPNSVTSIGGLAFYDCRGLTSISIPNSVTSIGSSAFVYCSGLTDMYCYAEIVPMTAPNAFSGIGNATLHVPASAVETYKATEPWSGFKEIVAIEEQNDYDWTIGVGGDFADINVAMTDSRVKDGDVLQVLKGNNAITGQQKITKAVTIQGNGYGSLNDGWLNGTLYVDCAGVTVKGLYVSDGIYLRHNDAVIERCRAGFISATNDYEADDATIRGCFITSFMEGDKTVAPLGWNIHNNIILGQLAYLEDATVNHNAIVYYGDGNLGSDFSMIHGVVESSFTNNIVFIPNKRTSFSSDVLSSLTNFENNIHTNSSNPTNWTTNIYGYETMAKLFACTGKEGTDVYYQTAAGSPAIGYANDGGDCGPWTGSFPYKLNGDDGSHGGGEVPIPEWQVEPNDLLALKNIHQAFGGDSWTTKKWNFDNNGHYREDFPGVTFTDDGRVTAIDLQDNGLVGECFAVSSPQLSELTTFNLSRNRISGDLGKLVSQLGKLTSLDVSYNRLTKTDGVMAFVEAFSSNINVRYQNRVYQTNSPTTAAFTDDMQTMEAQVVTIGKEMKLTVPSLYTYDYKYQEHRMNPPFKVRLMNSPSVNLGQLTYNGSSNYVSGSTYKFGDCGLYNQPQDQRMVLVDEWGSYARYSAFPVILRYVEGDADMTGATNVLDVQYMVNYILAPSTVGDFNYSAANTYADATINVQDIVQTVNIILGVPRTPNYASRAENDDDDTTWDGYVYAQQGRIVLTATKDVSAIDIDLEGVSTDEVALMLNRRDFQMIGRNTEWGSRYMIFSPTGKMIPAGTATALLRMSGAGQPVSVECANPQAQAVTVAVGSAPTGIAEVWGEAAQEAFYNLSGQRVANPRKGVYLQRGKKIVVKE